MYTIFQDYFLTQKTKENCEFGLKTWLKIVHCTLYRGMWGWCTDNRYFEFSTEKPVSSICTGWCTNAVQRKTIFWEKSN